jgi:predicted nucleic acid-binding protein
MTMAAKVFCDTNIILRAYHDVFPRHQAIRATFERLLADNTTLWISRQVIREYLVQITHPHTFITPLTSDEAVQHVSNILQTCQVADETNATTNGLLTLVRDYSVSGKQVHDANIVAVMLANRIDILLTLNAADFKRYTDRITLLTIGS